MLHLSLTFLTSIAISLLEFGEINCSMDPIGQNVLARTFLLCSIVQIWEGHMSDLSNEAEIKSSVYKILF
jgi:hypothetical protein